MGKKQKGGGSDLSKNKKGIPLYSREDIREQYCINEKELHVLDKNQRRSLLGCFTNHNQGGISPCSSGRNRRSLLGSCIARTSSEEDFHKKYEDNLPPPLSPGARSNNTWNARARMYHYGGGYHGVDEEDGFDEHYFRRRPKSFCMLAGPAPPVPQYLHQTSYRYPMDPALRLSMGSLIEPGDPSAQYCGAPTLTRHCSTTPSQYPSSSVQVGPPIPATNYFGVSHPASGNYAIPHGYYPIYSSKEIISERTQPNTPDLLMHRRQQNLIDCSNGGETSKSLERLIDNGMLSTLPPPMVMSHVGTSVSNPNNTSGDCMYGDTLITQEMARQVMMDRIKRNSMRTQATQTDVNRGLRAELYPSSNKGHTTFLPHARNIQMISEGVQTNGILKPPPPYCPPPPPVRGVKDVPTEIPGYKLQVYEIDTVAPPVPPHATSPPSLPNPPPPPSSAIEKRSKFQKSHSEGEILEERICPLKEKLSLSQSDLKQSDDYESDAELPELVPIELPLPRRSPPPDSPNRSPSPEDAPAESSTSSINEEEMPVCQKTSADIIVSESCIKRKQNMTLSLSDVSNKNTSNGSPMTASENTLIWQRGISNGEVKKKMKALEDQIQSQASRPRVRSQASLETPTLARSPAMHEGFKVENYIVERTPIQTPDEFPVQEQTHSAKVGSPPLEPPKNISMDKVEKGTNNIRIGEKSSGLVEPPTDFADSPIKLTEKLSREEKSTIPSPLSLPKDQTTGSTSISSTSTIRRVRSRSRSRSKERLLAKMADAADAPIVAYDEADDVTGLYSGNYSKVCWAFIGGMNKSYMEEPPKQMARSSSIESTQSERDFKKRHQAITHRMVHRRSSAMMYSRILERSFECNKTVVVQRIRGEFGFRIHGSRPVVISAIEPDTPAQRSGLEVGDIILSINGVNVLDLPHTEVVRTAQTGSDELELGLARVCEDSPTSTSEMSLEKLEESLKVMNSGYLWKLSRDETKRWIRRWFVLRADSCFYFFKSDKDYRPLGVHLLADSTLFLNDTDYSDKKCSYSFKISWNSSGESNMLDLAAESPEELDTWREAINTVSKKTVEEDFWLDIVNQRLSLPCNEFPGKIDAAGFLLKLDSVSKSWKKRYCLLCDSCLYLYSDSNSKSAIASLCLHGYKVQSTASLGGNKRHAFELMPPFKSLQYFYFVAETETEKKRWLASLEYSLDCWIKVS